VAFLPKQNKNGGYLANSPLLKSSFFGFPSSSPYRFPPVSPYLKILRQIAKPHWFEIIELIKCSHGLSVGELSDALGMSYMGIKKHCLAMHKLGYLETWRRPKDVGRPEKIYRLSARLSALFPGIGDDLSLSILEAATQVESIAAEKILFAFFRQLGETMQRDVTGASVMERAAQLAKARTDRGYFSKLITAEDASLALTEWHNPLEPLFVRFPMVERMECQMFEKLLGAHVTRRVERINALVCYRFDIFSR
jgi:predicted ArsR family transcriptional regulator